MTAALLRHERWLRPMTAASLDAVMPIESVAYDFPWSRGNFIDSLAAGYEAQSLTDGGLGVIGYYVAMLGVDEMHLLNLTVTPSQQSRGHARHMLQALVERCGVLRARQLWLEVRESNARARALYLRFGFKHVGVRRGYYPAAHGRREDAAVMSLDVDGMHHGLD